MPREEREWFQFYPDDWLTDGNVTDMTSQQEGIYIRLLCYCWREGTIPDNFRKLCKRVKITASRLEKLWPEIRECFSEGPVPGTLIQPRLEAQREEARRYAEKLAEAGRKGGKTTQQHRRNEAKARLKRGFKAGLREASSQPPSEIKQDTDTDTVPTPLPPKEDSPDKPVLSWLKAHIPDTQAESCYLAVNALGMKDLVVLGQLELLVERNRGQTLTQGSILGWLQQTQGAAERTARFASQGQRGQDEEDLERQINKINRQLGKLNIDPTNGLDHTDDINEHIRLVNKRRQLEAKQT